MFHWFADKFRQIGSFYRQTNTPFALSLDVLQITAVGFCGRDEGRAQAADQVAVGGELHGL